MHRAGQWWAAAPCLVRSRAHLQPSYWGMNTPTALDWIEENRGRIVRPFRGRGRDPAARRIKRPEL
jgi:hypothetical protein